MAPAFTQLGRANTPISTIWCNNSSRNIAFYSTVIMHWPVAVMELPLFWEIFRRSKWQDYLRCVQREESSSNPMDIKWNLTSKTTYTTDGPELSLPGRQSSLRCLQSGALTVFDHGTRDHRQLLNTSNKTSVSFWHGTRRTGVKPISGPPFNL